MSTSYPFFGKARRVPMIDRRSFLAAVLLPPGVQASALVDVLERPAAALRPGGKPSMLRITRAGARLIAVGERGIVLWSDDDGHQWQQASVPVSVTLTGVQFVGEQLGWAIGHGGVVLNTGDGGQTWTRQLDGRRINAAMQARADQLSAQQPDDPVAVRATKLAANAAQDGPDKPLLALHFSDPLHGWVVGAFGLALMTRDGGATWQSCADVLNNPKGLHFYALSRVGDQLMLAGEQGLLVGTPADGSPGPAAALNTPYRGSFFASAALADDSLLLGGLRGTLLLRGSGGDFKPLHSGTERGIVSITPLPKDELALVDQAGRVLLGRIAGGRFAPTPSDAERRWVSVTQARDGALVGAGSAGVARLPWMETETRSK